MAVVHLHNSNTTIFMMLTQVYPFSNLRSDMLGRALNDFF